MIPETIYKNLHLIGVFMILVALGGFIVQQLQPTTPERVWRRPIAITRNWYGTGARGRVWDAGASTYLLAMARMGDRQDYHLARLWHPCRPDRARACPSQTIMVEHHRTGGDCRLSGPQQALLTAGHGPRIPLSRDG